MKVKWLLATILLNIFAVLFVSIIVEYNSLTTRFQGLENNISTALDTAVDTSMMSEEFFSDGFDERYYSYALTENASAAKQDTSKANVPSMSYSKIFLYRGGKWIAGNTYVMSYAYQKNGTFPSTQEEIDAIRDDFINANSANYTGAEDTNEGINGRASVFSWLYGSVGQWYTSPELKKWSSTNKTTEAEYKSLGIGFGDNNQLSANDYEGDEDADGVYTQGEQSLLTSSSSDYKYKAVWNADEGTKGLTPTSDFSAFYNTIGQLPSSVSAVKARVKSGGNDTFKVVTVKYPTLWNMGLSFNGTQWFNKNNSTNTKKFSNYSYTYKDPVSGGDPVSYTEPNEIPTNTSNLMSDNWCASYHVGKQKTNKSGTVTAKKSIYMFTPMSLGVTYVPLKVTKPVFLANLENILRLGRLKGVGVQNFTDSNKEALEGANNHLETFVYPISNSMDADANFQSEDDVDSDEAANIDSDRTHVAHDTEEDTTYIEGKTDYLTDGQIEYDMTSAKFKVDYFWVDFSNPDNYDIVNRCIGAKPYTGNTSSLKDSVKALKGTSVGGNVGGTDTSYNYYGRWDEYAARDNADRNYRVVAKITVRMRIQVPYQAPIMQWGRYLYDTISGNSSHEHFGIKQIYRGDDPNYIGDESADDEDITDGDHSETSSSEITINNEADGLWYQYTTYRAISR